MCAFPLVINRFTIVVYSRIFSNDRNHRHLAGECWLKYQRRNVTRPKEPFEGHTAFPVQTTVGTMRIGGPVVLHTLLEGLRAVPPASRISPVVGRSA